ncbi:MAG TPA: YdeI/OmpD-associated family protein [Steroidobacteraceae bacterium]|nr:YdeI/OmpD-associated family protein [Steroidobacteraceae bacterium]
MNPLVSKVHGRQKRWHAEYAALRELCLASGLNEELKWGQACYDLDGRNVCLIHGFKDYCAVLFMKGALLKDPRGLLVQQTPNVQAARQIRFTSLADIRRHEAAVRACIREAIAVERSGARVKMKSVAQFDVPAEFQARLDDDPALSDAFRALTPGRQRGYLLHFAAAKREQTRAARVARHVPRILAGRGLDDPD